MGRDPAQGRGGRAEQEEAPVAFKTERQKVYTGKGAIVGQLVFEGEQVPGEASSELSKTVAAAEREASDLIHRDRVPRQYHKAVKAYFSNIQRSAKENKPKESKNEDDKPEESPRNDQPQTAPSNDGRN